MAATDNTILRRIRAKKRGWVFTPKNFIDIAKRSAIDVTLHRLVKQGIIRKLGRGIYDFPYIHSKLGVLAPNPDDLAKAIASKTGDTIQPSAARAANQLGIDTQVPAKPVYITSRSSVKRNIGNYPIVLRHSKYTNKNSFTSNVANTINAIRHLGKHNISPSIISQLKRVLTKKDKLQLMKNISKFPDWMAPIIIKLARK
ncbi:MAG TPA: DUF6088 family protein [Gammaproteobacteria bacterium]|jgi:hypothetical protein|nr:DUF6088 family protein [Gammaproteobacteria bacterium]